MIEIWDKAQYEQVLKDASVDFADLAEEVMGNIQNEE
jgi:MraZ protein